MVYMLLAQGFEEIEALVPLDILRRAGVTVTTVGISGDTVYGQQDIGIKTDAYYPEVDYSDAEMIILPGGIPGWPNLQACEWVASCISGSVAHGAYIAAICGAPLILGDMGLLNGRNAVCHPSIEDRLTGAIVADAPVVTDGKFITAKGVGFSVEFAFELVRILKGEETVKEIRQKMHFQY
jgi:protein deglycase